MDNQTPLLPEDALKGITVGISVSESPDLERLGLTETHFRLALGEITRSVLLLGGNIAYGGHLEPDGYTAFMLSELQRYGRRDRPLKIYLPWQEHRRLSLSELENHKKELGLLGTICYLDPEGQEIDPTRDRTEAPTPETNSGTCKQSLTKLRKYMAENTSSRILLGGKTKEFQGEMPGLVEETLFALGAKQPLYLVGGFGGITTTIADTLGLSDSTWMPGSEDHTSDPRTQHALNLIEKTVTSGYRESMSNGLSVAENQILGATYRPSEIAALISFGLGRKFAGD